LGVEPDSNVSPAILKKMVYAGSHATSFQQASEDLNELAETKISTGRVRRATEKIGDERVQQRAAQVEQWRKLSVPEQQRSPLPTPPPDVVAVEADGGRVLIFDRPGQPAVAGVTSVDDAGVAVPDEADPAASAEAPLGAAPASSRPADSQRTFWREDKIGALLTLDSEVSEFDPCPTIPETFVDPRRMGEVAAEIHRAKRHDVEPSGPNAGKASDPLPEASCTDGAANDDDAASAAISEQEQQLLFHAKVEVLSRQVVATRQSMSAFGPMLAAAAWAFGFAAAARKAFVADGAECHWKLWRTYFSHYTPILDFVHAICYVYAAAMAGVDARRGWHSYVEWAQAIWSGRVADVIAALRERQQEIGEPTKADAAGSPRVVLAEGLRYLENHRQYMKYDEYRREGLPITSSHIESTVKQINRRVKGSEKFWSSVGLEPLLQLTADNLSDNRPLAAFWASRHQTATGQRHYKTAA
jgi:hypothetical protein